MSDYHVTLPGKPRIVSEEGTAGTYEIDSLYPGYGHTLGNSLRRIILSSLPGAAITNLKIDGVSHEFSTIEGVKEDVVTMILNLRKVRILMHTDEPQTITIDVKGPATVTAKDIKASSQVEVLTPDQFIAEITGKESFSVEMRVERGLGYVPKEVIAKERADIGSMPLDAVFSPIRRVNYEVEKMRVGDRTDFDRLRMFIQTDGTLSPREALEKSIEMMIHQLKAIIGFKEDEQIAELPLEMSSEANSGTANEKPDAEILKTRVSELSLTARIESALDNSGIRTVGGLVRKREEDLLALEGLGQKGLQEIKRALSKIGLSLRS